MLSFTSNCSEELCSQNVLGLCWRKSDATDRGAGPGERRSMLFFQRRGAAELPCRKTDAGATGNPFATKHSITTEHATAASAHTATTKDTSAATHTTTQVFTAAGTEITRIRNAEWDEKREDVSNL